MPFAEICSGPRLALRIPFGGRVDLVFAGRQRHLVATVVTDAPGVRRAVAARRRRRARRTGLPSRVVTAPRKVPAGSWPRSISAATTGLRSPRAPTCSHASNVRDSPGLQRVLQEQVLRARADDIHVRRMQRDAPVFVVGNGAIGQRSVRRAFLQVAEARDAEVIAGARPQRLAREQVCQWCVAAVGHDRLQLDPVRARSQRVRGCDRDLAPVTRRLDDDLLRTTLDDFHLLIRVRPGRPVVRDEVGEDDPVACRLAVHHRCEVDDCATRHTVRHRTLDGEGKRELLVHHRDVACRGCLAVRDRRRSHDHLHGGVHRSRVRSGDEQREKVRSRHQVRH